MRKEHMLTSGYQSAATGTHSTHPPTNLKHSTATELTDRHTQPTGVVSIHLLHPDGCDSPGQKQK